ncbi:MAG: hypothetical protein ACRDK8_02030 [Solirubrobacteraceae bacterium]
MKFIANTHTEVAPNARPLIASNSANHPIAKVTTHARPLIARPHISHPIAEEASNAVLPLIHRHPLTAAAELATSSAAVSFTESPRPRC